MKASVKVREADKPLIRAKVPLCLLGIPLSSGLSVGSTQELAIHLRSSFEVGPGCKVSYYPNNVENPFAIGFKTGLGLWGSPSGAALALAADFNFSATGNPSFSIRIKPRVGDFGFRKDPIRFADGAAAARTRSGQGLSETYPYGTVKPFESPSGLSEGATKSPPSGLAVGSGLSLKDKVRTFSNGFIKRMDSLEKEGSGQDTVELVKEHFENVGTGSVTGDDESDLKSEGLQDLRRDYGLSALVSPLDVPAAVRDHHKQWIKESVKGWNFSAHSSLPLGRRAVAKVRWNVKFTQNFLESFANGTALTDLKLPKLGVEKVSIESLDPFGRLGSVEDAGELGYGFSEGRSIDDSRQIGRIAAMCCSMRHQLQLLHSENLVLKKTIEDIRSESLPKVYSLKQGDLSMQEERSQLFDELNGKGSGKSKGNGKVANHRKDPGQKSGHQDAPKLGDSKGSISTIPAFESIDSDVSDELKKAILTANGSGR